ncbi:hypothetical protein [Pedobacter gandavensis]|uniref:glycosyltransferase family 2 protein n=1 Tax=Pedobacter gandavensis TaxID=2679963 RepID=UPI00292E7B56|nr:hypothetical protein [Pedobacter gandavensis]
MIFFIYIVLVFLVLRFSVTLFNFVSNPKMGNYGRSFNNKVLIIIKVQKEKKEAEKLLASIAAQDYKNYKVLIQKLDAPDVTANAEADYLLFLEPNTIIEKKFINSLVYRSSVFKLAMLSVIPTARISGFLGNCIYPLNDFVLLNLFPLRLVRLIDHPAFAMANNSCMFFDADSYREYEWDFSFNARSQSALEMMKIVKQDKLKTDLLLGNKLIYLEEPRLDISGISKQLMLNFSNQPLIALGYLILVIAGPVAMALTVSPVFLLLPYGLIFLSRLMVAYLSAQRPFPGILYHPLQMLGLTYLLLNNSWKRFCAVLKPKK